MPLKVELDHFFKHQYFRLGDLPIEILVHVLSYLLSWDYLAVVHTSQGYRAFVNENAQAICLAALSSQLEISRYIERFTIDDNRRRYVWRWKFLKLRMTLRKGSQVLMPRQRFQHKPTTKPMFLLYLMTQNIPLWSELMDAYMEHTLGELIEIYWTMLGGLKHRSSPDLGTVSLNHENTQWAKTWRKKWEKVWRDNSEPQPYQRGPIF
ncbi:hypothetical protein BKA65DRAFT_551115 [Rhexocercosporidium sp. MPI-PUGE-AT-0058]|nr:hypothetical protein BKA65DRAFT_551115 [Rhexocercosporidium sp. MPI-PUGE-AT-0058]